MDDDNRDIRRSDTGYFPSEIDEILLTGLAAGFLISVQPTDNEEVVFAALRQPDGTPRNNLNKTPPRAALFTNTLFSIEGDVPVFVKLANLTNQIADSTVNIAAIPVQLTGGHLIAFVIVRQANNDFRVISFNSEGIVLENEAQPSPQGKDVMARQREWIACVREMQTALLNKKGTVQLIKSEQRLQDPFDIHDYTCGPRVAGFLCHVLMNPQIVTAEQPPMAALLETMSSWDIDLMRMAHARALNALTGQLKDMHAGFDRPATQRRLFQQHPAV